ncbi:probable protein kinase yloP-putative serine/threonine protein kinase [Blastopirellula marina DSM 3645]|uniref:Probable protein kinase yloP-putative serine/threonine protein kinase n=2 Tax=Blastopirellula marina TaxID=124 RepID=A3ZSI6_9BACT|nr:probable protein kinase yloP-putative serine/threonine protein kinase [Blastopirellula marina DSM 3645]
MLPREAMSKEHGVARFNQEVQVASRLSHPNIVTAFDADEAQGLHFLVMEHVDGRDLNSIVRSESPLSVAQAIDYITQTARGLEYAHAVGLIHRDIKPANLLLESSGIVKILDMGIARMDGGEAGKQANITQIGAVMGTVDFMAPEQAVDSKSVDGRADLYSLGCTLYYLLTRRPPFDGETLMVKLLGHREVLPPKLQGLRPDVPDGLELIYQKCMAKIPEHRYATATELIADLEKLSPQSTDVRLPEMEMDTSPTGVLETLPFLGSNLIVAPPRALATRSNGRRRLLERLGGMYGGMIGLALLLVGGYFSIGFLFPRQTPGGNLVVSVEEKDFGAGLHDQELTLVNIKTNDPTRIRLSAAELTTRLAPGEYRFALEPSSGVQTDVSELTIHSGADSHVRVYWEPTEASVAAATSPTNDQGATNASSPSSYATTTPIDVPSGPWIDLLSMIKLPDHGIAGDWEWSGTSLAGKDGLHRRVMVPYALQGDYVLEAEFTRQSGSDAISLHLPVANTSCDVVFSDYGGTINGLRTIDGLNLDRLPIAENAVQHGAFIVNGKRHKVAVQVTTGASQETNVRASLDGRPFLDWTGDNQRLSSDVDGTMPLVQAPGVDLHGSAGQIHALRLQHLENGKGRRLGDDWGHPFFPVADSPPAYLAGRCAQLEGRSYYKSVEKLALNDAQRLAKSYQGRLLTISSEQEQQFILELTGRQNTWMSAWCNLKVKEWRDERNRKLTFFSKWGRNQPDNNGASPEIFLGIFTHPDSFGWNDFAPDAKCFAVIEWGEEYLSDNPIAADSSIARNDPAAEKQWESIFNGHDLTGWSERGAPGWRVENQQIVSEVSPDRERGSLLLDKLYDAYELEFEYALEADADSGLFLNAGFGESALEAQWLQIQLLDDQMGTYDDIPAERRTGSVYGVAAASALVDSQKTPWRKMRVRFDGNSVTVYINNIMVTQHELGGQYPTGHIGLQRYKGSGKFRNLRIRNLSNDPAASKQPSVTQKPNGPWMDLLSMVQIPDHELSGTWRQTGGGLLGIGGGRAHLMLPYVVTGSYEIETEITRLEGDKAIAIHLPINSAACDFVLSSSNGRLRGFQLIDGKVIANLDPAMFPTQHDVDLTNGKRYKLVLSVQLKSSDQVYLSAKLDDQPIIEWMGDTRRLAQTTAITFPVTSALGLFLNETTTEFHSLKLRHLGSGEGKILKGKWRDPFFEVAELPPDSIVKQCYVWNDHHYYLSPEKMSLAGAQRLAADMQGRLLTVSSAEEDEWIRQKLPNNIALWTAGWRRNVENQWYDERNRRIPYMGSWETEGGYDYRPEEQFLALRTTLDETSRLIRLKRLTLPPQPALSVVIEWGEEYPFAQTPRTYSPAFSVADLDPQQGNMLAQLDAWEVTPRSGVKRNRDGYLQMSEPETRMLTKKQDWQAADVRIVLAASQGTEAFLVFEKKEGSAITSSLRDNQGAIQVGHQGLSFGERESGKGRRSIPYGQTFEIRFRNRSEGRWIDVNGEVSSGVSWGPSASGAIGVLLKKGSLTIKKLEIIERQLPSR